MKKSFLLDTNAFEEASNSSTRRTNSDLTRRAFLKRLGGATAAAVIAFHITDRAYAVEDGESSSGEGSSEKYVMVCVSAPNPSELSYDSGVMWDTGILIDHGIRAYYEASGPEIGQAVGDGGYFIMSTSLAVQAWWNGLGDPAPVTSLYPSEAQTVLHNGENIEYHDETNDDYKQQQNSYGYLGAVAGFTAGGRLEMAGVYTVADIGTVEIGVGPFGLSLPLETSITPWRASLEWSFSRMTIKNYQTFLASLGS